MNSNSHIVDDQKLIELLRRSAQIKEPPDWLVSSVREMWINRPKQQSSSLQQVSVVERILGVLKFDSAFLTPSAMGIRSASSGLRQLLFSAGNCDVDLRVIQKTNSTGRSWQITGQVLGPHTKGEILVQDGSGDRRSAIDEFGEFNVESLTDGIYTVMVDLEKTSIVLPQFELPPPEPARLRS
jgi:hypothetical protein